MVRDGETGYIVPPEDEDALADAVVRYFEEDRGDVFRRNVEAEARRDMAGELLRQAVRDFLEIERG